MQYELIVETFQDQNVVKLRLEDDFGQFKAANEVNLASDKSALWEGLFDTRRHVDRYEGSMRWDGAKTPETAEQILNRIGVFLGQEVLGEDIFSDSLMAFVIGMNTVRQIQLHMTGNILQ